MVMTTTAPAPMPGGTSFPLSPDGIAAVPKVTAEDEAAVVAIPQWPNFVSPKSSGASQPYVSAATASASVSSSGHLHVKRFRNGEENGGEFSKHQYHQQQHHHHHQQQQQQQFQGLNATWHTAPPMPDPHVPMVVPNEPCKRRRDANYVPPREIPKTLISSMGSLAAPPPPQRGIAGINNHTHNNGGLRVHLRQQLSGSNLMEYLGNHDSSMDCGDNDHDNNSRPRSMSF